MRGNQARTPRNVTGSAAAPAGLRYVSDQIPGIRRQRHGNSFRYLTARGQVLQDRTALRRIDSLAIPPAWIDVWICPHRNGHVQATGRDARGRKQHRYHRHWVRVRSESKFGRLLEFGLALPKIRQRVSRDLRRKELGREKVLAAVVRLLEVSLIRVGNPEYARDNGSFGLTTLRDRHASIRGSTVRFRFRGKSRRDHDVQVQDRRLARIVKHCQDLPGQALFQYRDANGRRQGIGSGDVNGYLRAIGRQDFTAKDFRTWAGTVLTVFFLQTMNRPGKERPGERSLAAAIKRAAQCLGNTPATCRKCYVHPLVGEVYLSGALPRIPTERPAPAENPWTILKQAEGTVLRLLVESITDRKRPRSQQR